MRPDGGTRPDGGMRPESDKRADDGTGRSDRMRLGDRRTAGLLLLVVLFWLAAAGPAVAGATRVIRERTTADRLGHAVDTMVVEMQEERRLSTGVLAGGDPAVLAAQRARTDQARAALDIAASGWVSGLFTAAGAGTADEMRAGLDGLGSLRAQVDARRIDGLGVLDTYGRVIDAGLTAEPGPAAAALGRAREALAAEDALLRAALSTAAGPTGPDRVRLAALVGARGARLSGTPVADDPGFRRLTALEERLLLATGARVTPADWAAAADPVSAALRDAEVTAVRDATGATAGTVATIVYAALIAGVGLVALIGTLVLARRRGRPEPAGRAPGAAAATAAPATGSAALLLDLHRRSQPLVHRLLRLLDGMERRQSDEETLADLFRADHLANRVRRNVETAIALAGGTPGRRWTRPVPLVDVVRGAAAEVPDYVRVSTARVEPAGLAGPAVTDVMHLLAELIDNATTWSPAENRVKVSGSRAAAGGYTITVADTGPGMSLLDLATAREVMDAAEPPAGGLWRGFHAVGRFAARQDLTIRLAPGAGGGLVAEVTLPADLIAEPDGSEPEGPAINRVDRMRARLGEMSDVDTPAVDTSVAGVRRTE
jgi:signal transduction histidine kinase